MSLLPPPTWSNSVDFNSYDYRATFSASRLFPSRKMEIEVSHYHNQSVLFSLSAFFIWTHVIFSYLKSSLRLGTVHLCKSSGHELTSRSFEIEPSSKIVFTNTKIIRLVNITYAYFHHGEETCSTIEAWKSVGRLIDLSGLDSKGRKYWPAR